MPDACSARDYHWAHAHRRNRISSHFLNFNHYPVWSKSLGANKSIRLPPSGSPKAPIDQPPGKAWFFFINQLKDILFLAYGAKDLKQVQGCFFAQRTVPSAGGLYPCHLYLALETQKIKAEKVKDQEKIDTGVYYYAPAQDSLIQIRSSIPQILAQRQEQDDSLKAFFIITASFYNSAWKYRHRAYRYMLLDSGHLVENLSMILKSLGIEHGVAYEFADTLLGDFLGIDMGMEVPLALVTIGRDHSASGLLDRFHLRTRPDFHDPHIPKTEPRYLLDYKILSQIHESGNFGSGHKGHFPGFKGPERVMDGDPILSLDISGQEKVRAPFFFSDKFYLLESLIKNRRSRRNFVLHPISSQDQQRLFKGLALGWGDSRASLGKVFPHLSLGMVCQNLQGRENGIYLFSKNFSQIHLMKPGDFAPALSKVCLDQGWISRAGIIFLFLSDLDCLEKDRGPRGYREMMMRAGRMAQTIYIMAQSLQLQSLPFGSLPFGACGVGAMYDFEAQALLGLTPKTALVYALAFGPVAEAGG